MKNLIHQGIAWAAGKERAAKKKSPRSQSPQKGSQKTAKPGDFKAQTTQSFQRPVQECSVNCVGALFPAENMLFHKGSGTYCDCGNHLLSIASQAAYFLRATRTSFLSGDFSCAGLYLGRSVTTWVACCGRLGDRNEVLGATSCASINYGHNSLYKPSSSFIMIPYNSYMIPCWVVLTRARKRAVCIPKVTNPV